LFALLALELGAATSFFLEDIAFQPSKEAGSSPWAKHIRSFPDRNWVLETNLTRSESGSFPFYIVTLAVGTPPQEIPLILDTGSSDFWVYGSNLCAQTQGKCCK
jgi:hypothetical protein